ncbi:MAG TPA: aldehyde dehydrogenase family protein [Candidatus Cybelea sp.]|nr:aldehyde dehydrogenase family protein [Candidatus Cybelea sp.]
MAGHRETAAGGQERFVDSVNPATGAVLARIASTPPSTMPDLMRRARAAQGDWARRPLRERSSLLRDLQGRIFDARDEIVDAISGEAGKPRVEATFAELILSLDTAGFLARRAGRWLRPERVPHHNLALKAKSGWLEYEPYGVVALISPWNYPFAIPALQAMAAVVTGNAVLLKPSELTARTGALVGELFRRAGCPEGLVQVVQGAGEIGAALVDAGPDKVFFTGSVATGKRIAEACGRKLIPSVLELGGKDAMIVLADADLDVASSAAVWGGFTNCGQACLSVERIYVEEPVADRFIRLCVEKARKLRVGPASDADADIGPLIRRRQLERVEEQLRDAMGRGAKILTGGTRRADLGPTFLEPAVVVNVDHSMKIMREETFGPVIAIRAVESGEEGLRMANDSPFALSASVWTRDSARAKRIASRLRAGSVMINDVASYYGISEAPHGGRGDSGWGRSHSRLGLLEMVQVKYVDVDRLPRLPKSWWFGYGRELAASAGRLVEAMFARGWRRRVRALRRGAHGLVFRRHRI